jgi:hypothetical protein
MEKDSLNRPADLPEDDASRKATSGTDSSLKQELDAISAIGKALETLDSNARQRAIDLVLSRYGLGRTGGRPAPGQSPHPPKPHTRSGIVSADNFSEIGALFEAARPTTGAQSALVAAYWFQVIKGEDGFASQTLNNALKDLGLGVKNITDALDTLKERKPSQIRQVQKSGSNKQARKLYKITEAGIRTVREMIASPVEEE